MATINARHHIEKREKFRLIIYYNALRIPTPLTQQPTHSILENMNEDINITEDDLKRLEAQVDELIQANARLQNENSSLLSTQESLVTERAELIEKTELAKTRVEAMITRLKSMETGT